MNRPTWHEYFFSLAELVATRSTCSRRQLGCVVVRDNVILTTGYNGQLPNAKHCSDLGYCMRDVLKIPSGEKHEVCRAVHSEQNAIAQAARNGVSLLGADIYITNTPCAICAKMIASSGITRVYVNKASYPDKFSMQLLHEIDLPVMLVDDKGINRINQVDDDAWRRP